MVLLLGLVSELLQKLHVTLIPATLYMWTVIISTEIGVCLANTQPFFITVIVDCNMHVYILKPFFYVFIEPYLLDPLWQQI